MPEEHISENAVLKAGAAGLKCKLLELISAEYADKCNDTADFVKAMLSCIDENLSGDAIDLEKWVAVEHDEVAVLERALELACKDNPRYWTPNDFIEEASAELAKEKSDGLQRSDRMD